MSAWKDFVTASLIGTDKGNGTSPTIPAALAATLNPTTDQMPREAQFLTRAGALALWRRTGWKPGQSDAAPVIAPAPPETGTPVHPASAAHLRAMLSGHYAEALPEWLGEAARRERRPPPEMLPALLDWAKQHREAREAAMSAGGARIRWLAGLNPDWNFAADDSPEHWETGSRDQRLAILRAWRMANPTEAREKLEAVWKSEPADMRASFLDALEKALSDADEPFLENTLDDRSKEVRHNAAHLLAQLPRSAFVARMTARATPLLAFKRGGLLSRASIEVTLPETPDAAAQRDGLDSKTIGPHRAFGEKAGLLVQVLAATPLSHWAQTFQQEPAALLKAVEKSDFSRAVATGWTWAAMRQRNAAWTEALLDAPVNAQAPDNLVQPGALLSILPEEARIKRLAAAIRRKELERQDSWREIQPALFSFQDYLPVPVAQDFLHELRSLAAKDLPWHLRYALRTLAPKIPPKLLPFALDDWPDPNHAADFVDLLSFRRDALAALAQS